METLTKLQLASLEKLVRIEEFGVVTKRQFMKLAKSQGWIVQAREMSGFENGEFSRRYYNQLGRSGGIYEAVTKQDAYEAKMNQKKTVYSIHLPDGSLYDITKTEFEYFNSL